jgi:hypothetical protein
MEAVLENSPQMTWNTNNTDIDLWVADPNNAKCYYEWPSRAIRSPDNTVAIT